MEQPTKSIDRRNGKARLRFASSKSRSKRATADVYRSSDAGRLSSRSSTGAREKRVHDASFHEGRKRKQKRRRKDGKGAGVDGGDGVESEVRYFGNDKDAEGHGLGRTAVLVPSKSKAPLADAAPAAADEEELNSMVPTEDDDAAEEEPTALLTGGTLFLTELELASQRNGARLFQTLARQLRPLSRSLAEMLHHAGKIVDLLCAYLLSPRGDARGMATPCRKAGESWQAYQRHLAEVAPQGYMVNVATNDVLHLVGVLARELRGELYPYLHARILPRIVDDLLNPPTTTTAEAERRVAVVPLDVSHVEAAFRAMSYLFKYNADHFLHNDGGSTSSSTGNKKPKPKGAPKGGDADALRKYYGATLCHKRDVVRRLAAEAYAPLLRKCPDDGLRRHVGRTVKALAGSVAAAADDDDDVDGDAGAEKEHMSRSSQRARDDAIDGVAALCFEVARGAPGRLHTQKGRTAARSLLDVLVAMGRPKKKKGGGEGIPEGSSMERRRARAVYEVASRFLYRVRGHVARRGGGTTEDDVDRAGRSFADVFDEMHRALEGVTSLLQEESNASSATLRCVAGHVVDLMTETIKFQEGRLVRDGKTIDRIVGALQSLLRPDVYSTAGRALHDRTLRCLCAAWRVHPSHPSFALRLGKFFPSIVAAPAQADEGEGGLDPALFLARHLLPHLPRNVASMHLLPALLGAAAGAARGRMEGDDASLVLLHIVATTVWSGERSVSHDVDVDDAAAGALFSTEAAELCPDIPPNVRSALIDVCLASLKGPSPGGKGKSKKSATSDASLWNEEHVAYAARCLPFLVCLECSGGNGEWSDDEDEVGSIDDSHSEEMLDRVFKSYASTMKALDAKARHEKENEGGHAFIAQSLVLESCAKSVMECHRRVASPKISSMVGKAFAKAKTHANHLLFQHPKSLWAVRGVAAVAQAISTIDPGSQLNDRSNETFELLVPNLAEANHFLRLYTLQILDSYPARPFVTDHADLDLTDDLEEEASYRPPPTGEGRDANADGGSPESALSGACDVISLLKTLESTPISLPNERKLTTQLDRVEVYARTGKLPVSYAEAVTCHMLGLMQVKFAPVWPAAVKVVVSLSAAQEGPSWPFIAAALKRSMERTASNDGGTEQAESDCGGTAIKAHFDRCVAWETSRGKAIDIIQCQPQDRNAQVSRHVVADELTLFQTIWSIMENAPHLTSTKSRVVVPIFFEFLVAQYYVFHQDDPDSREIDFADIVESPTAWPKEVLGRKSLQRKLECFLKMFAAVKGPQQLIKHKVLLHTFVLFLANPDAKLSNLAFACVLRYKLPFLMPYVEYVHPLLKKEGLREALTKLDLSQGGEMIDADHRLLLVPIVTRILFGRFSSRGNGAKSSKDSPAARRAAILSFFSGIGNEAGELNYFIYMMIRAFIPPDVNMKSEGVQIEKSTLTRLIGASERISLDNLTNVPIKRQEGFLNLLSDVITQIGFGVKHFVPTFMNLLLALCEQTEHSLAASKISLKNDTVEDEEAIAEHDGNARIGRIRSLSFLRLADMFTKFASSLDFTEHGERLWESMHTSVVCLPNTVINAENPPSLLQLMESMASHQKLIPLLCQSDDAIVSVFRCIAGTTRMKVMTTVLHIIDGLLTDGGAFNDAGTSAEEPSMGQALILKHIHMLIGQFTTRLTEESQIANLDEEVSGAFAKRGPKRNLSDGLQLNILCRVSELLVSAEKADEEHTATMESLCQLLVPLLKFDSHPNQLYLLRTVSSLLPKLSVDATMSHFHALSKLLGPNKNQAGISSFEHRRIVSSAISAICGRDEARAEWKIVAKAVEDLNAVSTSYVDEHDFERMLPVLNGLGASSDTDGSWRNLATSNAEEKSSQQSAAVVGTRILLPLIHSCFHLLYDSDGVVSRASNKALKTLVAASSELSLQTDDTRQNSWMKLVETTVVPCLKTGISTKEIATRRTFIMLISHVARHFDGAKSVHLYGDLRTLIRDDDENLDYFLNITHVQLHRRTRALNRLRKLLSSHEDAANKSPLFSDQSLGNVLLPLAMHPVYEYQTKTEEAYVVEAIATVGEISRHLPWSKWNNTLQSVLNNLPRYPDQERFLVAMVCSIIDAFHFPVETGEGAGDTKGGKSSEGNGVWRTLKNRIIPKVESFLIKEKSDRHGSKVKSLRSSVVLALMKLFQKLPHDAFEAKLSKLITIVCNALKNKDLHERTVARETLSKMAVGLDMKYLPLILSEMSITLSEGYKLHVRSATLHSILVAISKTYQQPNLESIDDIAALPLHRCVPAMLDLIHQDIFGKASEIKEVAHVEKRMIKEAMGKKSLDSLEIISKLIYFKPSLVTAQVTETLPGLTHASAVHALVTPFLERLRDPDVSPLTMKKVKECLGQVAVGFSSNSSSKYEEVLPFVYATIAPFIHGKTMSIGDADADLEDSDDEIEAPIQVSRTSRSGGVAAAKKKKNDTGAAIAVATWSPSTLGNAESQKSALEMKKNQKKALHRVNDGAAAPKLTGSSRHSPLKSTKATTINNPANSCALGFGLTLLHSSLKKSKLDVSDVELCAMADPYLPLLAHCARFSSDNQAVILSLRCLGIMLRMNLPSVPKAAKDLAPGILDHLTASGAAANTQSDIVQSCFKTLTLLISHPKFSSPPKQDAAVVSSDDETSPKSADDETLPLSTDQMQALLSLLHSAVREHDHHNSTFGLVKAISSKGYKTAEFYDLMDIILKLTVQSQKSAVRLQSSQIFLHYLLEYPMGEQRMNNHLRQIVLNIKYEYEEGRLSAIDLLSSVIQKFPPPVLESQSQLLFIPLVLQLVNDESRKCKEAVADCISLLLQRLSTESVQTLFGYAKRWSQSSDAEMQKASAQLFGIFVDARPDYIKRGSIATDLVSAVLDAIMEQTTVENESEWELLYHNLVFTEKLNKVMPLVLSGNQAFWEALVELLAWPHPWVMQVSSRIIGVYLGAIDPTKKLLHEGSNSFIVNAPGSLYKIASNLCRQLDVDDVYFVESTSTLAIKTITWVFRAMKQHPELCYGGDTVEEDPPQKSKDPCLWLMTRLSNIAKPKGRHRRESVFKCFAALCASCNPDHLVPYLELMIDPLDRSIREANNTSGPYCRTENDPAVALPKDVLQLVEDTCGTEAFLNAHAEVNRKVREKRDKRKQEIASEAIHDPTIAAKRKVKKHLREKERKKRKVEEKRSIRGASKKGRKFP